MKNIILILVVTVTVALAIVITALEEWSRHANAEPPTDE